MANQTAEEILTFSCSVITPQRSVYTCQKVTDALFDTTGGKLEIQPRHEPVLAPLAVGHLRLTVLQENGETKQEYVNINGGFLDMNGETATVFAYSAETAAEIDAARARGAEQRAKERLDEVARKTLKAEKIDAARAEKALYRAISRLKLYDLTH